MFAGRVRRGDFWALVCLSLALSWTTLPSIGHTQVAPQAESTSQRAGQSAVLLLQTATQSINALPYVQYWVDPNNDTTLQTVLSHVRFDAELFKPAEKMGALNLNGQVLWLRLEAHTQDVRERWLMELGTPLVEDVQLYWRDGQGLWLTARAGDNTPRIHWPQRSRLPTFALQNNTHASMEYYLRIRHSRAPIALPLTIERDAQWIASNRLRDMLVGAMMGALILTWLTSIVLAVRQKEQGLWLFVISHSLLMLYVTNNTGLTSELFWPQTAHLSNPINYVTACLCAAAVAFMVRSVVVSISLHTWLDRTANVVSLGLIVLAVIEWWMPSRLSYLLLNVGVFLIVILVLMLVIKAWPRGTRITRWIALCFSLLALPVVFVLLRNIGLIPVNAWLYGLIPAAVTFTMPLLLHALIERNALQQEMRARVEGLPITDLLTGLPNLPQWIKELESCQLRAKRFAQKFGIIIVDISNLNWFASEHGEQMAQRAVLLASARLQKLIRDVDCICRIDQGQFAILVEGPCKAAQLSKLSAQLLASGQHSSRNLPVGASLKLQLTCVLLPCAQAQAEQDDSQALLAWAIQAAEQFTSEPTQKIRMIGV